MFVSPLNQMPESSSTQQNPLSNRDITYPGTRRGMVRCLCEPGVTHNGGGPDPGAGDLGYRTIEICGALGITYRQITHWDDKALVSPSIAAGRGCGHHRLYSYADLVPLAVIRNMVGDLFLEAVRPAVSCLRDNCQADLATATLVLVGGAAMLARGEAEILDLVGMGEGVLVVLALGPVVARVNLAARQLELLRPASFDW